jgi:GrpB-like predicted nucleotidyltransferase (UPF0157 family)
VIEVVEYETSWPERFRQLHDAYAAALGAAAVPFRSIEHVGSTSVPGSTSTSWWMQLTCPLRWQRWP